MFLKIHKKQSLNYQIMIIFMHEHYLARFSKHDFGAYMGENILEFEENQFEKMTEKVFKTISKNYKNLILENFEEEKAALQHFKNLIVLSFNQNKNRYCAFYIKGDTYYFKMKPDGYRYQYNGYMQSDVKLNQKANLFIGLTLTYYVFDFFLKNPDFEMGLYLIPVLLCFIIPFFTKKIPEIIKLILIITGLIILIA